MYFCIPLAQTLCITTQLTIYGHLPNIINSSTKFKDQLEVQSVTTSKYMCIYINISKS
jgi:hypothetical protein